MISTDASGALEWARRYDQISDPQFTHGRDLIDLLGLRPGDHILDVGCGTGRLAAFALDRIGANGRVVGIDPAAERVDLARKLYPPRIEFGVGSAEDLSDYQAATFDAVYMNSTFEWLEDKPRALAEVSRVLKPEGRFGISTSVRDRRNELRQLVVQANRAVRGVGSAAADRRGTTIDEVRGLLHAAAFRTRVLEQRTYVSSFEDVPQILEFLDATTFGAVLQGCSDEYREAFRLALERSIDQELPAERRENGIRLERYVLLVVADKTSELESTR